MASTQMENLCAVMRRMMNQQGMPMFGAKIDPVVLRATIEAAQSGMPLEPGVSITQLKLGGVEAELCTPENALADGVILYIHGGGLICGNAFTSRGYASMLAGETKRPVYTLSYRLAPEHPFPAAVEDCLAAYRTLLDMHPGLPIALIGESGGAHLCLTTTLKAREMKLPLPAAAILYSPVTDMSDAIDRSANAEKDFTVTPEGLGNLREMYCPGGNLADPCISPLYADYTGFAPVLLAWDSGETLAPDSALLAEKARAAGVEVEATAYDDCFHAFATTGRGTPESAKVLADTVDFISRHFALANLVA